MVQAINNHIKVTFLTERGYERLNNELDHLRNVRRQEIALNLHEAVEDNDLTENDEYLLIKNEQAIVEGRISELESLLRRVEIIKPGNDLGKIRLGSQVTIQEDTYPSETYAIVGSAEADSRNGFISDASPLGKALLQHQVGDVIEVNAPDGKIRYKILSVT
jgi:transcription elongation factor GreA